jgi:twinkle protein
MSQSRCVEKIGSIQVFQQPDGSYDAYDFATGTYIPDPYKDKPQGYAPEKLVKSPEQSRAEVEEVLNTFKTFALEDRKLSKESLEYFGVKVAVSETDGITPIAHYYPYHNKSGVSGYKVRLVHNKRMWAIGSIKDTKLFGWDQAVAAGSKRLFITEGELDAVALFQIFRDANKGTAFSDVLPSVVSLQNGAGGAAKSISKAAEAIRKTFQEVVLVFDMDEAGRKAVQDVLQILPEALVASLPEKDANDCLIKGKSKACHAACQFRAARPKNTRLVSGNELHEAARQPPKYGISWPWKHITTATRGIRKGETIYIGAGQKQGKSEIVNTLTAHFIKEHGWKVFLVKPEESNNKTYKLVAGKLTGKFFHDPTKPFDEEAYESAGEILRDKLYMLNLYQHVGWETLKADIRQAAQEGCEAIIIDPITNLTNGLDAASSNTKLQEIAQELSSMALDLNVVIFIFCHLRNPDSGPPHERGGEVLSSQFAGSRAMARSCNLMLGLEGNRDPNLSPEERNIRTLVLLEDREFGETGRYKLYWDRNSGLFNEV